MSEKKSALEALRSARHGGNKRSEQYTVQVDDILEDTTEEQYRAEIDARKRKGNFVVDDATGEYEDDGEDKWDDAFYEEDLPTVPKKRGKSETDEEKKKAAASQGPGRLAEMFAKPKTAPKIASAATLAKMLSTGDPSAAASASAKGKAAPSTEAKEEEEDADLRDLMRNPTADGTLRRIAPKPELSQATAPTVAAAAVPTARKPVRRVPIGGSAVAKKEQSQELEPKAAATKSEPQQPPTETTAEATAAPMGDMDDMDAIFAQLPVDELAAAAASQTSAAAHGPTTSDDVMIGDDDLCAIDLSRFDRKGDDKEQPMAAPAPSGFSMNMKLPLDEHGNLLFYWIDAAEYVAMNDHNTVHIFGKVQAEPGRFVSCCLIVRNVPRIVYAVPRQPLLTKDGTPTEFVGDMLEELESVREKFKIRELRSKPVVRNYAFEFEDIPRGSSTFMKLRMPSGGSLPRDLTGATFSHVIGTSAGPLEQVILKCGLRGPEWLYIVNPRQSESPSSWCAFEATVDGYKSILKPEGRLPFVPLTLMGLCLKTVMNHEKNQAEVVAASLCVETNVYVDGEVDRRDRARTHTAVRRLGPAMPLGFARNPTVQHVRSCGTERELLSFIFDCVCNSDPDVIIGHNITGFDIDLLIHRAKECGEASWSKLGRLRLSVMPKKGTSSTVACRGRLLCDTYTMAKELIYKQKSYRLVELAETQLNEPGHISLEPDEVAAQFATSDKLAGLVRLNEEDARLVMRLAERVKMLSLTKQLTGLAGNLWCRTLAGHRAERVEYLLLHEFHRLKFVVPDKHQYSGGASADGSVEKQSRKKKAAYSGGMVLEPKVGFYDRLIVLLDFKSLYPSLIQEYNVCFTTVERHQPSAEQLQQAQQHEHEKRDEHMGWVAEPPEKGCAEGILPRIVRSLVEQRRRVRSQMEAETKDGAKAALNIRQSALKLIANSLYGCLGFEYSRFYARPLAELVTRKGRETLQKSMELVTGKGLSVIYGDTDSLMVNTGLDDLAKAKELAREVIKEINQKYRSLEIDIDNVFRRMLLLKKKNYACTEAESGKRQIKGLYLVRRDWCDLSKEMGQFVLDRILNGAGSRDDVPVSIYTYLSDMKDKIRSGQIPAAKFGITKSLSKDPDAYDDAKSQPHVMAAKILRAQGKKLKEGDFVTYVICKESPTSASASASAADASLMAQRAQPLEVVTRDSCVIDVDWYMTAQLFPPIMRLCRPIEEIDVSRVAESLGLDPAKHVLAISHKPAGSSDSAENGQLEEIVEALSSTASDPLKALHDHYFGLCEPFLVRCPHRSCANAPPVQFAGLSAAQPGKPFPDSALCCPRCKRPFGAAALGNQLVMFIRTLIARCYRGTCVCENTVCQRPTRSLLVRHVHVEGGERMKKALICSIPGCKTEVDPQYTDASLYYQLLYLRSLFDASGNNNLTASAASRRQQQLRRTVVQPLLSAQQAALFNTVWRRVDSIVQKNLFHFVPLSLFDVSQVVAPRP